MTDEPVGSLDAIVLFTSLPEEDRRVLASKCRWQKFGANEKLLSREDNNRDVFFVVSGSVRVVNHSLTGREIAYATIREGGYFGELSALDGQQRSANVVVVDDSLLGIMEPDVFKNLVETTPEIAMKVIERLARIVRSCDERIMDLSILTAHQRVYRRLLDLMTADPVRANSWLIYPLPTQAQIAAHAGTTRETVARVLSQLAASEMILRKGRTLYIRNPDALSRLTELTATDTGQENAR